jgi:acetyl esterase
MNERDHGAVTTSHVELRYSSATGQPRAARLYRSTATPAESAPLVVDVHGGHWSTGDRRGGEHYDRGLAARGFAVLAIDFRQAPRFTHPAASADIASAVRWSRGSAARLGFDPGRIALVGSSSGGHLALLAACRPDGPEHASTGSLSNGALTLGFVETRVDGTVVDETVVDHAVADATVSCVVALWSPVDPLARFRYAVERLENGPPAQRARFAGLVEGSIGYFGSESVMGSASIERIVAGGEATHLPPLWLCYPSRDLNVPRPIVERLRDAWAAAGGLVEMTVYEGQPHGFGHRPGPAGDAFVGDLATFLSQNM